jgi:osomolarity two-component system response regulator SSK1
MTTPSLPALRSMVGGKSDIDSEGDSLELPSDMKLGIPEALSDACGSSSSVGSFQSSSEGASTSNTSIGQGRECIVDEVGKNPQDIFVGENSGIPPPFGSSGFFMESITENRIPRISRTLSVPLPSQLSQLQNPHRPGPFNSFRSTPFIPPSQSPQIHEVSVELADSIQLVIQTMLQISPPQVLDPIREQFSACALCSLP